MKTTSVVALSTHLSPEPGGTMPRIAIAVICLLLLPWGGAATPTVDGSALVYLPGTGEGGPPTTHPGLMLTSELPDGYLGWLNSDQLAGISSRGSGIKVLDPLDDGSRDYLIVFTTEHPTPATRLITGHRLLMEGSGYRVVSIPADQGRSLACYPDLRQVFHRPLRFVSTPWGEPRAGREADPVISSMVAEVSQGELEIMVQHLQDFGTRHSEQPGGYQASLWIRDQFLAYGYTDVTFHDYNSWNDNVVCVKPGRVNPDRYIVLGGHYDSTSNPPDVAPGADDNATGTAGMLTVARLMADADFEYSVIFIAFSGEEEGLVGSDHWASEAAAAGLDIVGMINLDMIGYLEPGDDEDLDLITNEASLPLQGAAFDAIATYVPELTAVDGYLTGAGSDHMSFWSNGYRAVFLFEDSGDYSPYIHTVDDVIGISVNSFPFMVKNVKAAVAVVGALTRPFHIAYSHTPLEHAADLGPFSVEATLISAEPLDPATVQLHYRLNGGGFVTTAMDPLGGDLFGGTIPGQTPGNLVEYYLTAANSGGYTAASPGDAPAALHRFRVGVQYLFVDDCEFDLGWTLGEPGDDAISGIWVREDPVGTPFQPEDDHTADPGSICFVTGNAGAGEPAGANDVDGGKTTLLSPIIDLSAARWAELSYWLWYVDEVNFDDVFRAAISNDGGGSWLELESVTDSRYPWNRVVFDDLGALIPLTDRMQLRFVAEDQGNESLVEACIDDLQLVILPDDMTDVASPPPETALLTSWPNPFNPRTLISYRIPRRGLVEIGIFTPSGAEVATPLATAMETGAGRVIWDAGNLPSGIYMVRLSLDGETIRRGKLTLLK